MNKGFVILLRLLALCLYGFSLGSYAAGAAPALLQAEQQRLPLAGHLATLRDTSGRLDWRAVQGPAWAGRFTPLAADFNGGFTHQGAWWIRATIRADFSGTRWLALKAPFIDRLDVYHLEPDAQGRPRLRHRLTGNSQPLSSRDMAAPITVLRLPLQAGDNTVWIRAQGVKAMHMTVEVWHQRALSGYLNQQVALTALLIGVTLVMAMVGLLFGVWLREKAFVWYAVYVAASGLLFAANDGFIAVFLLPTQPYLATMLASLAVALCVGLGPRMIEVIFDLRRHYPVVSRLLRGITLLAALAIPVILLGRYDLVVVMLNLLGILGTVLMIGVSLALLLHGQLRFALPYFVGFAFYGVALCLFIMKNLGWVPSTEGIQLGYQLSTIAHIGAIAFALALRVRDIEQERVSLQNSALAASREVEQVLERKVVERTRALHTEIEERRLVERRLYETLREQRHLLSMVSHEFRTPLGIISLSAQTIIDLPPDGERACREAARILRANQRLTGLIDTCLADEWLESAHMQLKPVSVDLGHWLDDFCAEKAEISGRKIAVERLSWPLPVAADLNLLPVIFGNLLDNAVKYSPAGSPLALQAWQRQGRVLVTVADQGPGIPPAERELVFEKYYRSPRALKQAGVGLGLHVVRRMVELHGGWIAVAEREGGGAVFTVGLPACERFEAPQGELLLADERA